MLKAVSSATAIIAKSSDPITASNTKPTSLCLASSVALPTAPTPVSSYDTQQSYVTVIMRRKCLRRNANLARHKADIILQKNPHVAYQSYLSNGPVCYSELNRFHTGTIFLTLPLEIPTCNQFDMFHRVNQRTNLHKVSKNLSPDTRTAPIGRQYSYRPTQDKR